MKFNNQLIDLPNLYHTIDHSPLTITADSYVIEAIVLMSQQRSSSVTPSSCYSLSHFNRWRHQGTSYVLVVEAGRLVGILTNCDVVRLTAAGMDLSQVKIAEVMTRQVITFRQSNSGDIFTALSLLQEHQISHLPIVDDSEQLLGIVTEQSLLQAFDLVKMLGVVAGLQQYLQQPTIEQSLNQQLEDVRWQTQHQLNLCLAEKSAELTLAYEALQQTLEELQVAEEELRQQNEQLVTSIEMAELDRQRYQNLFEFAPDGYLVTDTVGVIKEANYAAATLLNLPQKHLLGKPLVVFISQPYRKSFMTQLKNSQQVQEWEIDLQPKSGSAFPARVKMGAVHDAQGRQIGWCWLLCNISERKQAQAALRRAHDELEIRVAERTAELTYANVLLQQEITERQRIQEALQERERLYRQLVERQTELIIRFDFQGRVNFANAATCQTFGLSLDELHGRPLFEFVHPEDLPQVMANMTALTSRPHQLNTGEQRLLTVNGVRYFEWNITPIEDDTGEVIEFQSVGRDITERKVAEQSLRESEARLTLALEAAQMGIWDWNLKSNECIWSANMGLLYGLPIGYNCPTFETFLNFIHLEDRESFVQNFTGILEQGNDFAIEYRVIWPDGSLHWLSTRGKVYHNELGQPVRMLGTTRDISERQAALRERKLAEEKIREQAALLDITTDGIFVRDLQNQIVFWNQGAQRLYGWQQQEALGKNALELLYKQNSPQLEAALKKVIECGSWKGEMNKVQKSGKEIIVESRWTLVRYATGEPKAILCVDTDITEKKQLEAQFFRAQRLESLGTLAGGIAHDLNNILTPILAAAQLLKLKGPQNQDQFQQLLPLVENNAKRGAALVKQVLSFARGVRGERTIVQVKHLIAEISQIIKQTFPKSIQLSVTIPEDLSAVYGDVTQLHQVLMNLVVNARDAMPEGGKLRIIVENMFIDEAYAKMNLNAKVGDYIVITVADTGIGIPPEILERIFEPFFTTKDIGTGTGLGLSTVLGIIKSHSGFVNVNSKVGKGSQFQLFLPAAEANLGTNTDNCELPQGNGELILVVDDEAQIREITKIILENHNYKTLIASNGIEAIALYAQYKHHITAVLMDMMMPEMDGITAIRTLQKMNPQVQIIASSGINPTESLAEFGGTNVRAVLTKPYTAKDLLTILSGEW